jgi:transcriptional regulator with XRE-family HTH domain
MNYTETTAMPTPHENFKNNIKVIAFRKNMTMVEVAEASGISRAKLYKFMNGEQDITFKLAFQLAEQGFGIRLQTMLAEDPRVAVSRFPRAAS